MVAVSIIRVSPRIIPPSGVGVSTPATIAVVRRTPSPAKTEMWRTPTEAHGPTWSPAPARPPEPETTVSKTSIPIPRIKPRIEVWHARRAIVKTVDAVGIYQILIVFKTFYIFFIGIFVSIIVILSILNFLFLSIRIIIIRTQIILGSLGLIIIHIVSVSYLLARRT